MTASFDCRLPLAQIRDGERVDLIADEDERDEIARRLGLRSIGRLEAHAVLERDDSKVRATGRIRAALEQSCVATGEPVQARVDEPFELSFLPEPKGRPEEDIELGEGDLDVVFHDGAAIDLGGALADTLALVLDPYPRSPNADAALKAAGVMSEEQAGPFAALGILKGAKSVDS